jgi:hypothetical protein
MSAAITVVATAASAEGNRTTARDPGAISFIAQHTSGTNGGWSG